jgi:hypothetical protein
LHDNSRSQGAAFVEGFIHDIPGENLATVARDHLRDVLLQELPEFLRCKLPGGQPGGIRASPHQGVSAHSHAMSFGKLQNTVGLREVEGQAVRTYHPPLHRIFRFDHVELAG